MRLATPVLSFDSQRAMMNASPVSSGPGHLNTWTTRILMKWRPDCGAAQSARGLMACAFPESHTTDLAKD